VAALGAQLGREIEVRARAGQHQEQFELTALDAGPPVALALPWLPGGNGKPADAADDAEPLDYDAEEEAEALAEAQADGTPEPGLPEPLDVDALDETEPKPPEPAFAAADPEPPLGDGGELDKL
jgi:hypothetical protein